MAVKIELQLISKHQTIPTKKQIQLWIHTAETCLPHKLQPAEQHCIIRIVDKAESGKLNKSFRHKNGPTNVLSFMCDPIPGFPADTLGDIVICAPLVAEEATQQNKSIDAHWAHLTIHGFLHLLGYDHIEKQDAETMETLEVTILNKIGFNNPYIV